ncbi:MAG: metallophosphoesterase family protein [bacterium]
MKILDWIVDKGNQYKTDYIIIAGDLFDSNTDATLLRAEVKKVFEKTRAEIMVIPGNHDAESYGLNYDYGKNVKQLIKKPFELFMIKGIKFLAIPFQSATFSECIKDLSEEVDILIAHGTVYDLSILPILNQESSEYMPIYPKEIENLCRCALLGHIHSQYIELSYRKAKVLYPGAPLALSTKCRESRKLVLLEITEKSTEISTIDIEIAPHWQELNYFVFPGNEETMINKLIQDIKGSLNKNILLEINIHGYITENEIEFKTRINQVLEEFRENFEINPLLNCDNISSWDQVLKIPFVKKFVEKTSGLDDELRTKILELTFPYIEDILK